MSSSLLDLLGPAVLACPLCKESENAGLAQGFGLSIYVMLGTVAALAAFAISLFSRAAREADRRSAVNGSGGGLTAAGTRAPPAPSVEPPARSR